MPRSQKINWDDVTQRIADGILENAMHPNIKKYVPHKKQEVFHSSPKAAKLYLGGNRSGKTTGGVTEGIWRATCRHPYRPELNELGRTRGRVVGVDFTKGIDQIILPQYQQWVYPSALRGGAWYSAYDAGAKILNFSNGSTIEFMSYEQSLEKFAGTSRHWIHFDEEPPQPIYLECLARLIDTNGDYWITMTPVEGMTWIYDELYEPNLGKEDSHVLIIEIYTTENPYLKKEAIEGFALNITDDDDATVRIEGGFVRKGGLIYKNFDPTPGKLQVMDDVIHDPNDMFPARDWLWIMGLDHGLNNPTAVIWTAWNKAGFGVAFDEYYVRERTVDVHALELKKRFVRHGRKPDLMVIDPSTVNRNPITNTSVHQEYQKYGLNFVLGNNDVKSGVVRVRKYFNPAQYVGNNGLHPLFKGAVEFPKLRIAMNCPNFIWEAKRYRWRTYENKQKQYENNPYDEPHKKDDHLMDALRYVIMTRPDLMRSPELPAVETALNDAMTEFDGKLARYQKNTDDRDDPYDRLADPTFVLDQSNPGHGDGWEFDEHMGNII